jgi:argininosuccinate lyase
LTGAVKFYIMSGMKKTQPKKPWSGRFKKEADRLMERFNASIGFDRKLYRADIRGSIAQARALCRAGILSKAECDRIIKGLGQVEAEIAAGKLPLTDDLEDIHMAVEQRLTEIVGPAGGKLHTGRSRNDQVALDERLYLRDAVDRIVHLIEQVQAVLLARAEDHLEVLMPGYTHLQQAQPILFSHYAMSLFYALERDKGRFCDCRRRADRMPLGSGALAGTAFPIDRQALCKDLGFAGLTENSIDAVSDRDYILEFLAAAAILMAHLSRYCEDLILWSSSEFGFVEVDDAFATGSSMMPQKKNPDALELIRGKTGRIYGNLVALLTVMKGIPMTYAKDMQEDKEPLFDTAETLEMALPIFARIWATLQLLEDRMRSAIRAATLATDLADYLVKKGVPFRECHHIVGGLVREAIAREKDLRDMPFEAFRERSALFDRDVYDILTPERSVALRNVPGGTSPRSVRAQIVKGKRLLRKM